MFPKSDYYAGTESGGWAASVNNTYDGQAPAVNATKQANVFIAIPDTNDVTVTTYAGSATSTPPKFSKNVMYPTSPLTAPPLVNQSGGDNLDLGDLAFTGVAWRKNTLYAATTVNSGGKAAVRVFGIKTASGVSLASDKTLKADTLPTGSTPTSPSTGPATSCWPRTMWAPLRDPPLRCSPARRAVVRGWPRSSSRRRLAR